MRILGEGENCIIKNAIPYILQMVFLFLFRMKVQLHLPVPTVSPKIDFYTYM
jgi:hypothetical protein